MKPDRLLAAMLTLVVGAATNAQERWQVFCVDDSGQPVANAEVYVWQTRRLPDGSSSQVQGGPFTSDADGATATVVPLTYGGGNYSRWVYARVPGKLVGTLRAWRSSSLAPAENNVVTLSPSRSIRGRVTVPDGFDPERVLVKVASLYDLGESRLPQDAFPRAMSYRGLENTLPDRFECRVGADGSFEFHDFPKRPFVVFLTEASGLAHAQWSTVSRPDREMPEVVEIDVVEESVLGGTVTDPDGKPVPGVAVALEFVDHRAHYRWTTGTTTDANGSFRIDGLPAGEHAMTLAGVQGVFRPIRLTLRPGESRLDLQAQLESGIELRGVVMDQDGKPVEGVVLMAITQRNDGDTLGSGRTDPQGRFTMLVPSGPAHLYIASAGIDRERSDTAFDLEVTAGDKSLVELRFNVQRDG